MRLLLPPSRATRDAVGESAPIDYYSGVLYQALEVSSWTAQERAYALEHLVLHDKEHGLVAAGRWDPLEIGELSGFVLDARSKEYARRIKPPANAWTLRVVTEGIDGRRLAVSHWNKHHKGVFTRALVRDRAQIGGVNDLVAWSCAVGISLEVVAEGEVDLLV